MLPITRTRARTASPFEALWDIRRDVDRLFEGWDRTNGGELGWVAPAELRETADELRFSIELPGMRHEDIELTVENNVLTVSGEKKLEQESNQEETEFRLFERRYGRFSRSFALPPTVDADQVEASYENGVLAVRLPKAQEARPRRIQIGGTPSNRQVEAR